MIIYRRQFVHVYCFAQYLESVLKYTDNLDALWFKNTFLLVFMEVTNSMLLLSEFRVLRLNCNFFGLNKAIGGFLLFMYLPFHKSLPRSRAFVNWISVWFYETCCSLKMCWIPIYFVYVHADLSYKIFISRHKKVFTSTFQRTVDCTEPWHQQY